MSTHNEGIIVSGGSFQSGSTAVGRGATVYNSPNGEALADLRDQIAQLQNELARIANTLPAGDEARTAAAAAADELAQPQPRKVVLGSLLNTVLGAVAGVSGLVTQVEGIAHAVQTIL
jgi:hypothetical protein